MTCSPNTEHSDNVLYEEHAQKKKKKQKKKEACIVYKIVSEGGALRSLNETMI